MDTAVATAQEVFQDIGTNVGAPKGDLSPNTTRYGFRPIWDIVELSAAAFYTWDMPAGVFRPFRLFKIPVDTATGRQFIDRTPQNQILDMVGTQPYFVEFESVARLENEVVARKIFTTLANPNSCSKYPMQLKNRCAQCWLNYLTSEGSSAIYSLYSPDTPEAKAAMDSYGILTEVLQNALVEAERQLDEAVSLINSDDPRKMTYVPNDIVNIQHTHNEMPEYRTTSGFGKSFAKELGEAIRPAFGQSSVVPINPLVDEVERLRTENERLKLEAQVPPETDNEPDLGLKPELITEISVGDTVQTPQGAGVVKGRQWQRIQVRFEDGTVGDFEPDTVHL